MESDISGIQRPRTVTMPRKDTLAMPHPVVICPTRQPLAQHGVGMSSFENRLGAMVCSISGY